MGFLIFKGIIAGLGVSLLVGPLFFGLIQLSIEKSVWAGIIFASGIWVSDLLYVRLIQLGLGYLGDDLAFQLTFGIIGSVILIIFGLGIFFTPLKVGKLASVGFKDATNFFLKGAAINLFNPFVLILWVSILSSIRMQPMHEQWIFIISMLSVVAVGDVVKAAFAARIGAHLEEHRLRFVKRISGVLIGMLGVILLARTVLSVTGSN